MKIYDCITFFQSNLLFELRFHTLKNIVDHFVICEATKTHMGKPKKILFNLKKWKKYGEKIIFIRVDDLPKINPKGIKDYALLKIQMEKLFLGINNASNNDLIIFSDEDEIPNPTKIKDFKSNLYKYGIFMQNMYNYKINILNITEGNNNWPGTRICKRKYLKSFFDLRILKVKNIYSPFWKFYKEKSIQLINNGGWHFSFIKTPEQIIKKIEAFAHSEFNIKEFKNKKEILKKLENNEDLFDRNISYKRIDLDNSFPDYLVRNKNLYKKWIIQ